MKISYLLVLGDSRHCLNFLEQADLLRTITYNFLAIILLAIRASYRLEPQLHFGFAPSFVVAMVDCCSLLARHARPLERMQLISVHSHPHDLDLCLLGPVRVWVSRFCVCAGSTT
jgi:hypothetical protein